jgi:hypothetical protein
MALSMASMDSGSRMSQRALVHLDAQRLELGGGFQQRLGAAAADGHLGAQPAQLLGHQQADARATARHDSDVTLEQTRSENALHAVLTMNDDSFRAVE